MATSLMKKRINSKKVAVVPIEKVDVNKIKGNEIFQELYNNVFICAKKHSGKTNVIWNLLKDTINKRTTVYAFVGTHFNDKTYDGIKPMLDYKKIKNEFYDSMVDDNRENILLGIINSIKKLDEPSKELEEVEKVSLDKRVKALLKEPEEEVKKPRPPKKLAPRFLFLFDDISSELKSKVLDSLLKQNRHYKALSLIHI